MNLTPEQAIEIDEARAQSSRTRRATVEALEDVLFTPHPVLDHGFIRVIDYMGDDAAVVQAARVSYGKGTRKLTSDAGLINYLMRHRHTTPFEMCDLKLHVKLPVMVARQWIRHRTASVNEYSARYSILDREFYIPQPEQLAAQATNNRQGRGDILDPEQAAEVLRLMKEDADRAYDHYQFLLNEDEQGRAIDPSRAGLARELARMGLSLNTYTQWYWKVNLHNLLHFLGLRMDSHAQYEIRQYADIIGSMVEKWVPLTWQAFLEYRYNTVTLSATAAKIVGRMLAGDKVTQEESGLSQREWRETMTALGVPF